MRNCWVRSQGQDRQKYRELEVPLPNDGLGQGRSRILCQPQLFPDRQRASSEGLARGPDPCKVLLSKGSEEEDEQMAKAG